MSFLNLLVIFFFTIFFTIIIYKISIPFFKNFVPDKPNLRSSHKKITPSGGGLIFALVGTYGFFLGGDFTQILCLPIALIGFFDDIFNLSRTTRYFFQLITGIFCLFYSRRIIDIFSLNIPLILSLILALISLIAITSIINFSNFMDGIDGLLSGCFFVIFASMVFIGDFELIPLCGALLGFLFWNWAPAKIFMGDSGSTFLGSLFAFKILSLSSLSLILCYLIISSPLFLDALITLIRRIINKQNIFKSHNLHLYQRLYQSGWKHNQISLIYIFFTIFLSITYKLFGFANLLIAFSLMLFIAFYVDSNYAVPFNKNKV